MLLYHFLLVIKQIVTAAFRGRRTFQKYQNRVGWGLVSHLIIGGHKAATYAVLLTVRSGRPRPPRYVAANTTLTADEDVRRSRDLNL